MLPLLYPDLSYEDTVCCILDVYHRTGDSSIYHWPNKRWVSELVDAGCSANSRETSLDSQFISQ
jgi:hypothetical protein